MRVVNVYDYGGVRQAIDAGVTYVGRPTPLGNPYPLPQYSREASVANYRRWLFTKLRARDPQVVAALEALAEDSVLGCFCKPAACHGDVIASAWDWWVNRGGRISHEPNVPSREGLGV